MTVQRARRKLARLAATVGLAAAGVAVLAPPAVAAGHPAGVLNSFAIGNTVPLISYDVAANSAGRAYIGWITDTSATARAVHLCTLPVTATTCQGRTETLTAQPKSSKDLKVLLTADDVVKLVWFHDTDASISGPQNSKITLASAPHGQNLVVSSDTASAPSFGDLLTAEIGPGGHIWTVAYAGLQTNDLQVRPDLSQEAYATVTAPVPAQFVELAFAGGKAVLITAEAGHITVPIRYAVKPSSGGWGSFHNVANTWNVAAAALETTRHGMRLVTTWNNAVPYRPVISKWTGTAFTPRQITADNCDASTHDGYADPSGRLLDVSQDCASKLGVANYADALHAALTRFPINGTLTFKPQVASGTRGIATVVWSVLGTTGHKLRVAHVLLADPTVTKRNGGTGGKVTVTGPRSCLPPVDVHVGWTHRAAANWNFLSGSLRLGSTAITGSTLNGATLTPGKTYTLTATALFGRGAGRSTVKTALTFTSCGTG